MTADPDTNIDRRLDEWVAARLLTAEQRTAIRAFERDREAVAGWAVPEQAASVRDRTAALFGILGSVLVGLGVILVVAANWDSIGDGMKVAVLVIGMLVANTIALVADSRGLPRWMGAGGYVVGVLVFAAGVFLLGQLYNVRAHDPLGFLAVACTASLVAVLSARLAVGFVAGAAWLAWGAHELVVLTGDSDELFVIGGLTLLALTAFAIGWSLDAIAGRHAPGTLLGDLTALGTPLRTVAQLGALGLLVPASFAWHGDDLGVDAATAPLLVALAVALLAAAVMHRTGAGSRPQRLAALAVALAAALVAGVSFVPDALLVGLAANALLVGGALGLAALGLATDRRGTYGWGVAWIVAAIAARYVDVLVTTDLGGLGFIGAGLVLIGCGWLVGRSRAMWRSREER